MRYHSKEPDVYFPVCGEVYKCDHIVYDECTLFKIEDKGLAIIQQRYDILSKRTYWGSIDEWINNLIYYNKNFITYFNRYASTPNNDIYPTVTVRQIMWALRLKPLKREKWETTFDHCPI